MANFYKYFMDRLRDNLHLSLCFSPMNEKFPIRAQKFPALFSSVSITWFLPWPPEALVRLGREWDDCYYMSRRYHTSPAIKVFAFIISGIAGVTGCAFLLSTSSLRPMYGICRLNAD